MGLTPLEGLVMGTRCGDLIHRSRSILLINSATVSEEVETMMNQKSGLLGLSEVTATAEVLKTATLQKMKVKHVL